MLPFSRDFGRRESNYLYSIKAGGLRAGLFGPARMRVLYCRGYCSVQGAGRLSTRGE